MKDYRPTYKYPIEYSDGWKKLTGRLPVRMTNDYLFRALLQSDNETLKAILASVLFMDRKDIKSARITNEVLLGERLDEKEYILDVSLILNNEAHIDLEMQVVKEPWWRDRSLSYIHRSFDGLNRGMGYGEARAVRQIAFCDFTLFNEAPEFYATYKLINVRNPGLVYSDKFVICNIDLTRTDLATEEDRRHGIDKWALFFKAGTWEDMKMLAAEDETMERAIAGMWKLTEEEMIQARCRAREDWEANHRWMNNTIARQKAELEQKDAEIARQGLEIEKQHIEIERQHREIERQHREIERQESEIGKYKAEVCQLEDDTGRLKKEMEQIKKIMKELSHGKV